MLRPLQELFPAAAHPDLLVGLGAADDAAVWRLDASRALVATTDFFTPVVDDPHDFGFVAAANALSDLYAMGATPFLALNIAAVPADLDPDIVGQIFRGGAEAVLEAGAVVAGGHTVQDKEPKFGLVALGMAAPDRLMTKAGVRSGDIVVLTKPLGTGVTTTALKQGQASAGDVADVVGWMKRLNAGSSRLALESDVRGATDVTGYSLLGHGTELADSSRVRLRLHLPSIPFLRGAPGYARRGFFPGGSLDNQTYFAPKVTFAGNIDEMTQMLLFDAQTSGGLLLALAPDRLEAFMRRAEERRLPAWPIGVAEQGSGVEVVDGLLVVAEAQPGRHWGVTFLTGERRRR